jgi:acid phosphatase (class A)
MRPPSFFLFPLLLLGLFASLRAAPERNFIPPGAAEVVARLPPPPADDTFAGQADLETLIQVQADRTPAQVARAQRVAQQTAFLMGASVFGPWFTPEALPRTAAIFEEIQRQSHPLLEDAKRRWNRPRPYVRDTRIHPCVELSASTSYPSGHSASSAIWATIFSVAFPERRPAFEAQVHETMWGRVLGGVHFPSDTQAGRELGEAIGRQMLTTDTMTQAISEIRAEVSAYLEQQTQKQAQQRGSPRHSELWSATLLPQSSMAVTAAHRSLENGQSNPFAFSTVVGTKRSASKRW